MTSLEKAYAEYRKNKLDRHSWRILAEELLKSGRRQEAVLFCTLLQKYGEGVVAPAITEQDYPSDCA